MSACLNIFVILVYTRRCFVCAEQIVFFFRSTLRYRNWQKSAQSNEREHLLKGTYLPNSEIVLETLSNLKLSLLFNRNVPLGYSLFRGVRSTRQANNEVVRSASAVFVYIHLRCGLVHAVFHINVFLSFQQAR